MIVTCPNCETRYNLPDDKIPAGGAKVKCSKCAHVFKAELPPASPEEEVEALLEEESLAADTQAGEAFDETFDDVAATAKARSNVMDDEPMEEDMSDMDDLFEEDTDKPDADEDVPPSMDDLFESDEEGEEGGGDDDTGELFADEEDGTSDEDSDLFEEGADEDEDVFGEEPEADEGLNGLALDQEEPERGNRKSLGCLIILLVLALGLGAGVYFKVWTYMGVDLGGALKNVPFVGGMFADQTGGAEAESGESPAERVRKIELKNVKQYYVANEKVGNLFVVEGKAINKFAKPKEQIKVEVLLYDATNNVLASQAFLCGNVLSQFQLQVQSEKEIKDGLASEIGVLSNNTFIRPGASTPFMAVFFQPPTDVKEFMVKVVDVADPK